MIKVLLLVGWLAAVSPLLPATPKAKRPAPWTRRGAAVDAGDAGIEGGAFPSAGTRAGLEEVVSARLAV